MEVTVFQRIQEKLQQKRQNLSDWLSVTSREKKEMALGSVEEDLVHHELAVIDEALDKTEDGTLGLCEVCHDTVETRLLEMDYTACICLDHFTSDEKRRLEAELEFSQIVQQALMPQQSPSIPGLDVTAFSRPAQIIGGDYFDFFEFQGGGPGLVIADAMGHGVSAGMLMASLQTALRTLVPESASPVEVLRRVNRVFLHNVNFTTFVTAFLACFDPANLSLSYCNAGHNPPLLLRGKEGCVDLLAPTGAAIGLVEDLDLHLETLHLLPGDTLLLYTDGVTEATNPQGEDFGLGRLVTLLEQVGTSSAQEVLQSIRRSLVEFVGNQPIEDDVTLLVAKVLA